MIEAPERWKHDSGFHLNANGKSLEYTHRDASHLRAIVKAKVNEKEHVLEYYTVIFDERESPSLMVETHEFHRDKETAQKHLKELMKKHS